MLWSWRGRGAHGSTEKAIAGGNKSKGDVQMTFTDGFMFWIGKAIAELVVGLVPLAVVMLWILYRRYRINRGGK